MPRALMSPAIFPLLGLFLFVSISVCQSQDLECTSSNNDIQVDGSTPGSISTPNYPDQYSDTLRCIWRITVPDGSLVKVTIKDLEFGEKDYVVFFDGNQILNSPEIARYAKCAGGEFQLFSSGRHMSVWFVTDPPVPGKGFKLDYKAVASDKIKCFPKPDGDCPMYTAPDGMSGIIRNPESPKSLSANVFCSKALEVPPGNRMLLTYHWFGLADKRRSYCADDNVRVIAAGSTTIHTFCGCDLPPKQIFNSVTVYLELSTWRPANRPGLVVSYRALGPHECKDGAESCASRAQAVGTNIDGEYCYESVLEEVGGEITVNVTSKLHIVCDQDIEVTVKREDYPGLAPHKAHLEEPSCKATFINDTVLIFKFGPEDCKTEQDDDGKKIHYKNAIYAIVDIPSDDSDITRKHRTILPFQCSYEKKAIISKVSYSPRIARVITSAEEYGNFTYFMDMYTNKDYDDKIEDYPVEVGLGQRMYLEGRVESGDKDLLLFPELCKATLSSSFSDKPDHLIIEDACSRDNTLQYNFTMSAIQRFSLAAFRFKQGYDDVYIHCKVTVCRKQDSESRCVKGCSAEGNGARRKRSLTEDYSVSLYVGPVDIKESRVIAPDPIQSDQAVQGSSKNFSLIVIATVVGVLAVVAVGLIIALVIVYKRRRQSESSSILEVNEDE